MPPDDLPPSLDALEREAAAAAQLAWLGDIHSPTFRRRLDLLGNGIRPETLVSLIQATQSKRDVDLHLDLGKKLTGRESGSRRYREGHVEHLILYWAKTWNLTEDEDDLKEFRQQAYLLIWRAITVPEYRRPGLATHFPGTVWWILKSARDFVVERRKKSAQESDLTELSPADSEKLARVDHAIESLVDNLEIRRALADLPPLEARAIELRYIEGLPPGADRPGPADGRTVASEMGITPGMVRRHLRNARRRLALNPTVAEFIGKLRDEQGELDREAAP